MLKQLYIKNFKGFKEELIEIKDVNFLVGENSTGKTALLKLINVLSSYGFWYMNEGFNNNEVELGYFKEIKNQLNSDDFFRIGVEMENRKFPNQSKGKRKHVKLLLDFYNDNGNPLTKKLKFSINDDFTTYSLRDENNNIFHDFENHLKEPFSKWVHSNKSEYKHILELFFNVSLAHWAEVLYEINPIVDQQTGKGKSEIYEVQLHSNYKWLAPIRAKAKRTYESFNTTFSPEGDHIPVMLKNILNGKRETKEAKAIIEALENFGKKSNLFDKIEVDNLGQNGNSTFKINILYNGLPIVLPNVGYGVAQALPLLIEILNSNETLISLQQPEVHLHPRAQAAFGDFVYDSCKKDKNRFLIETHSEYMIDRFRQALNKAKSKTKNPTAQVLYFERNKRGNKITAIPIKNDGRYEKALPKSFERFFLNEKLNTLHI